MDKSKRITIDLDSKSRILLSWIFIKGLFKIKDVFEVNVKKSYSGNYHLIFWSNRNYSQNEIFKLRKKLFDDKNRIRIDKLRGYNLQTLFYDKVFNRKGK